MTKGRGQNNMKNTKKTISLLFIMIIAVALITATGVFAIRKSNILETYQGSSATNFYNINGQEYYFNGVIDNSLAVDININNYYHDSKSGDEYYFDLLIFTDTNIVAPNINGYNFTTYFVEKYGVPSACHIYKKILHENQNATLLSERIGGKNKSSTMDISLSFTTANSGDIVDIVVLPFSEKNIYIEDFYQLQKLNNESLYNIYNENVFKDYVVLGEGEYQLKEDTILINGIGSVIYDASIDVEQIESESLFGTINEVNGKREISFNISKINFEYGKVFAGSEKLTFVEFDTNIFTNPKYGMKIVIDDANNITFYSLGYVGCEGQSFIYFISDIVIDKDFTLNIPSYLNLLYSKLTLYADFTIEHHYGGAYAFENINNNKIKIIGEDTNFSILAPYCYYQTSQIDSVIDVSVVYDKVSDMIDFTKEENLVIKEQIIEDSLAYAKASIPKFLYNDVILPKCYFNYPINYVYGNSSNITSTGKIIRSSENLYVTDFEITVIESLTDTPTSRKVTADFVIIGKSFDAKMQALDGIVTTEIEKNTDIDGYFSSSLELGSLISSFIYNAKVLGEFSLSLTPQLVMSLRYKVEEEEVTININQLQVVFDGQDINIIATSSNGNIEENLASFNQDTGKYQINSNLILRASVNAVVENVEKLTISYNNGESCQVDIPINGMEYTKRLGYIKRYLTTIYLGSKNKPQDILTLVPNDGFYVGDNRLSENLVISSTLGAIGLNYQFFRVMEEDCNQFFANNITLEELIKEQNDISSAFNIDFGEISVVSSVKLNKGEGIIAVATIEFDDEITEETTHKIVRLVKIPENGIGGEDYSDYTNGNTFGEYFSKLNNNRLLYSVATTENKEGNAYIFSSLHEAIKLELSLLNTEDLSAFFNLVRLPGEEDFWQMDINIDNVPTKDTFINLKALFYIDNLEGERMEISAQYYDFVIPGVYLQGRDIADKFIYERLISELGSGFLEESGKQIHLLSSEAKKEIDVLDFTSLTTGITDIRGIEYLENTKKLVLDNINIKSMSPFGDFKVNKISELSLCNTNLTNELVTELKNGNERSYLYYLTNLEKINLSGNSITTFTDENGSIVFYRTIKELIISNNFGLKELNGLSKLPYLKMLDISNNQIAVFNELENCKSLDKVILTNNVATDITPSSDDITFGSGGSINIPVYVALIGKGVEVVIEDLGNKLFTEEERLASLVINAIGYYMMQSTINGNDRVISFAKTATSNLTSPIIYDIVINCIAVEDTLIDNYTLTNGVDNDTLINISNSQSGDIKYKIMVSVEVESIVVYKQFEIIHRS